MAKHLNHFTYMLQSADGKYYTGYTTDLERRMQQHQTGKGSKFVRGFGFDKLLYHEKYLTKSLALKREAEIKRWSREKKETLMKTRCVWSTKDPIYIEYHDTEWGVPVYDDRKLFEFLILEGAQAGLSWLTILKRRENYRKAFSHFDPEKVARYKEAEIKRLLKDAGIIRNQLKIRAAVSNAKAFLEVQKEFGSFSKYNWQFVGDKPIINKRKTIKELPATTKESDSFSKDLKKRGFKFVGSTIIYAHMQATGMVNDHTVNCFRHKEIQ